jgi:Domain of unknown function (DUF4349)
MGTVRFTLAALATAALLTGCGASSSSSKAISADGAAVRAPVAANGIDQPASGTRQLALSGKTAPGKIILPATTGRSIIYTASLSVRAKNIVAAANQAKLLVTGAGGYVESESESTDPVGADLTFKIPADGYGTVLDQLASSLGTKLSLKQNAQDVTAQVADVNSRVKSAQATLDQFRQLLAKANSVGEVLSVEQEISSREADLESLQAQQKALGQQTQFGTITLNLQPPPAGPAPQHPGGGFTGGLSSGWHAFRTFFVALATLLGWLLPFLVLGAVIGLPAERIRRNRRRPTAPPVVEPAYTAAPPPPEL